MKSSTLEKTDGSAGNLDPGSKTCSAQTQKNTAKQVTATQ